MRRLRCASFEEFVHWYLARERRKRMLNPEPNGRSWNSILTEMRGTHPDKLRDWFSAAEWSVVSLDEVGEATRLVCVDGPDTRSNGLVTGEGIDNRLAGRVVVSARANGYFDNDNVRRSNSVESHFRQDRIEAYRRKWPQFTGDERLALCTLNQEERLECPGGTYYLHDGFGRLMPWLYAIVYEGREYHPVEAFLAEER